MTENQEERKYVLKARHGLRNISERYGNETIWNFYQKTEPREIDIPERKKEDFLKTYKKILAERFEASVVEEVLKDFEKAWFAGTADHAGPVSHPFFFNNALAESVLRKNSNFSSIHFFPCSLVSLDNSSYPRGFSYLKDKKKNYIPLVHRGVSRECVYSEPSFTKRHLDVLKSKIEPRNLKLKNLLHSWDILLDKKYYVEQLSLLNFNFWKSIEAPINLISIELETISIRLILEHHIEDKNSPIYKIIFTHQGRTLFFKNFINILGAHSNEGGSFMFWQIESEKRKPVFYKKDTFFTENDEELVINEATIKRLLENKEIVPTMALSFSIISFYYGVRCGGGFSQIDYLGNMKEAYLKILKGISGDSEYNFVKNIETNIFRGEIGLYTNKEMPQELGSGLDFYLEANKKRWFDIENYLKTATIEQALTPMYPLMYKIVLKNKKQGCLACGNNPTNHTLSWISNTLNVLFEPTDSLILSSYLGLLIRSILDFFTLPYIQFFRLLKIVSWNTDSTQAATRRSEVIWEEAKKRNIIMKQLVILKKPVEFYMATLSNGKKITFESIPNTTKGWVKSYVWMDDKYLLKKKLHTHNIPVPKGKSISSEKELIKLFNTLEKPLITKPRIGSRGRHTTTYLKTIQDAVYGFLSAKKLCHFVMLEEHIQGSVYRGTLVNGKVVGVLEGEPPRITGDGIHTIKELIEKKNENKKAPVKDVVVDKKLEQFLERVYVNLKTVLAKNQTIDLSEKIGTSYGGTSSELFEKTHPKIIEYLEKAGKILDAGVIGFDFIIQDPTSDPDIQKWGIIECNSLPFINLHHDPVSGTPINVAGIIWDEVEKIYAK